MQPDSIRVMGDKSTARETMKNAGVPTVPGSDGLLQVFLLIFRFCIFKLILTSSFDSYTKCRARKKLLSLLMALVSLL